MMNAIRSAGSFHPAVLLLYFACVIILGMGVAAPLHLAIDLVASGTLYLMLKGRAGSRYLGGLLVVLVAVTVLAPLFDPRGSTVLFEYFGGRIYTLEALANGAAFGVMLVAMLLWFASFNILMTSERLTFLFGRVAPALSLVLTMVLRLVPGYQRKLRRFAEARSCIGKSVSGGSVRQRTEAAGDLLSMTLTWAFESGIRTADSMRSRGYGLAGRTAYAAFRFDRRDAAAVAVMAPLAALSAWAVVSGAAAVTYLPEFVGPSSAFTVLGVVAYAVLAFLPSAFALGESCLWRFSLSRI